MVDCLDTLGVALLDEARIEPDGHASSLVRGGGHRTLQQTVVALMAGQSTDCDRAVAEATLLVLRGAVAVTGGTARWEVAEGELLDLPAGGWRADAFPDSVVLVTWLEEPAA